MKILKRISTFILMAIVTMSSFACGCTKEKKEEESVSETVKYVGQGTHIFEATETSEFLLKDGQTDYILVTPAEKDVNGAYDMAKKEFVKFFKEATGVTLNTRTDKDLVYDENAKYISIGETTLLKEAGITVDKATLQNDGARIETKGKTIFIYGGSSYGALFGVYDFMTMEFNFDFYYTDCYDLDTNVKDITLKNYNVTDIPELAIRAESYGWQTYGTTEDEIMDSYRYRIYQNDKDVFLPIYSEYSTSSTAARLHNTSEMFPKETWMATHPKWFAADTIQPCFTAHGDEEELEAMICEGANKIQFSLQSYTPQTHPNWNTVTVTIEDGAYHCGCESCMATASKYGGCESAAIILFMNRLAEKVDAWMELPENAEYKRDLTYMFFAYNFYKDAPAYYDAEKDSYFPLADELLCRDDVGVYLCVQKARTASIYADENYDEVVALPRKWAALSKNIYLWFYTTNFTSYICPSDTYGYANEELYSFVSTLNCKYFFQQSQYTQEGSATAFHLLKAYIDSKLMWNSSLSSVELTKKFFNAMYRDAADTMFEFFEDMRMHWANINATKTVTFSMTTKSEYWPYTTLTKWDNLCEKAMKEIAKYEETDKDLYDCLVKHIDIERAFIDYNTLEIYSDYKSTEELNVIKKRFKNTVEAYGLSAPREGKSGELYNYVADF